MLQLATEYDFSIAFERLWDVPSPKLRNDKVIIDNVIDLGRILTGF